MTIFILAVVVLSLVALWVAADRARTVAVCDIRRGELRVVRGRLSPRVLSELRDVVRRGHLVDARIVVIREGGAPTLRLTGVSDENVRQQLRNVIGRFKIAELR